MNEKEIEKEIVDKGLTAPRLCPADIDAVIVSKTFTNLPSGKCMVCEITLKNGFTVRGESACVSPANFDEEIGQKISFEDARKKIWGLEAYLLQEKYPVVKGDVMNTTIFLNAIQIVGMLKDAEIGSDEYKAWVAFCYGDATLINDYMGVNIVQRETPEDIYQLIQREYERMHKNYRVRKDTPGRVM